MWLRPGPPRPDIVLFVWDTCRADRTSAYGHGRPTSPHLDAMAKEGALFQRCLSPSPWTPPAHGSLFTGLLPRRHGLREGEGDQIHRRVPLLAETLGGAGYETVAFTCNANVSVANGLSRGFQRFQPVYDQVEIRGTADMARDAVATWLAERQRQGARGGRKPLFLFVNLVDAHITLDPPEEDVAAVRDGDVADEDLARARLVTQRDALAHLLGVRRIEDPVLRGIRCLYDAGIHLMDRRTAEILDLLRGAGHMQDGLAIVTSDHGENLGEHGQMDHRLSLYDTLLHVPLVMKGAGGFTGGRRVAADVRLQDLYATILSVAGVPMPVEAGLDSLPLRTEAAAPRVSLAEFSRPLASEEVVRSWIGNVPPETFLPFSISIESITVPDASLPRLKYLRYLRQDGNGRVSLHRQELFDLDADPGEARNLLAPPATDDAAGRARRLAALLDAGRASR